MSPSSGVVGRRYFSVISAVLLVLTVIGFSDNLVTNIGQPSNRVPRFLVHGLVALLWMVLLTVQANLIRVRSHRLHRRLGITTMIVAAGVSASTLYLFFVAWTSWAVMPAFVRANRLLLPAFIAFVLLGYRHRNDREWHKRDVLVGTLLIQEPIFSRVFARVVEPILPESSDETFGLMSYGFISVAWLAAFTSLGLHDWRTLGRIHPVTVAGVSVLLVAWAIAVLS